MGADFGFCTFVIHASPASRCVTRHEVRLEFPLRPADARKRRDKFMVDLAEDRAPRYVGRNAKRASYSARRRMCTSVTTPSEAGSERTRAANIALVANKVPAEFKARAVTAITPDMVADVLRAVPWNGPGANAGSKLRQLIEGILASKDIEPNPAKWERLKSRLSTKRAEPENRKSIPFANVPAFVATLTDSIEDRCELFTLFDRRSPQGSGARYVE